MALQESGSAPYAPAPAIVRVIDHHREKGIAGVIDAAKITRIGVEESLATRTISAMKQLDLLGEDGNPTPTLDRIQTASSEELQAVLADWLRDAYKPIFQYVDPSDDVTKIGDQFRHYDPKGMRNRMVTLFLGLCAKAGLIEKVPPLPRKTAGTPKPPGTPRVEPKKAPPKPSVDDKGGKKGATPATGLTAARERYVDLLMAKATDQEDPPADLLNRIERALGISGGDT